MAKTVKTAPAAAATAANVVAAVAKTRKVRDTSPVNVAIVSNVDMPTSRKGLRPYTGRFPFDKMNVGDSFALPVNEGDNSADIATMLSASARAYSRTRHENKFAFTVLTREIGDGKREVRIWRKDDALPRPRKSKAS